MNASLPFAYGRWRSLAVAGGRWRSLAVAGGRWRSLAVAGALSSSRTHSLAGAQDFVST